jgi:hypothetical protein
MRKFSAFLGVATILVGLVSSSTYAWYGGGGYAYRGVGYRGVGVGGWHGGAVGWHGGYVWHGGGYGHVGCYGCGVYHPAWHPVAAAAAVGTAAAVGAAAVRQPVYAPPVYAYPIGATLPVLPGGCAHDSFSGVNYYNCARTWYRPYFGSNGVYYQVAPAP